MNPTLKAHLISAVRVFVSTFIVTAAGVISTAGSITWTETFWLSIGTAAVSAAIKAAFLAYTTA